MISLLSHDSPSLPLLELHPDLTLHAAGLLYSPEDLVNNCDGKLIGVKSRKCLIELYNL